MTASGWDDEIKMLRRWARWCERSNNGAIMKYCGLSPAGSPPTLMAFGAADEEAVTGYAREHKIPDAVSPEVDLFMASLIALRPTVYRALLLKFRRIVDGQHYLIRSERALSGVLYELHPRHAWPKLARDCEIGYRMLRKFIETGRS
ncbi:MAG: hypothetical protein B7X10_00390 [Burkholderiales bacterium 21-58-4]|nr:MAG: hypothetical protein B7X10_00390 [Burkholderiales bacterium 21-58-4]